jgi:outer membrane lipoprotein carrier protein
MLSTIKNLRNYSKWAPIFFSSCVLALVLAAADGAALAASAESLSTDELRELQGKLNQRQNLSVRFTQIRTSNLRPKKPSTSSGRAVFAKPAKFRWEFEKPSADILLFDGRSLISFKPGEKTATRFNSQAERAKEIKEVIDFVLDFDALLSRYSIKQAQKAQNEISLTLQPKSPGAISELKINIDGKSYFVSAIKMTFQNRNVSEFKFIEPTTGVVPMDAFSVPSGVQVLDGV